MAETNLQAVESLKEDFRKCYEYFSSEDCDFDSKKFKTQMWHLAKMAYLSFYHLTTEFERDARAMDAEDSEDLLEAFSTIGEDQEVSTTSEKDQEVSTTTVELQEVSTTSEDLLEAFSTNGEDQKVSTTSEKDQEVSTISEKDQEVSSTSEKNQELSQTEMLPTSLTSVSTTGEASNTRDTSNKEDYFINTILQNFKKVAPNSRYKPRHLRGKKYRVIPYEFSSLWRNLPGLYIEKDRIKQEEGITPRVAWDKVNKGAISKFPKPCHFQVHSVSPTASFYERISNSDSKSKFQTPNPFGSLPGYITNLGVVPVPDIPMFGHIWDPDICDWIIHAEIPTPRAVPGLNSNQGPRNQGYRGQRSTERRRTRGRTRRRG